MFTWGYNDVVVSCWIGPDYTWSLFFALLFCAFFLTRKILIKLLSRECGSSMTRRKGTCGHMKEAETEEQKDKIMEFMWGHKFLAK